MTAGTSTFAPAPPVPAAGHPDLLPWRPTPGDRWDLAKAAHLMRRAGFGARPEELDAIVLLGMDRTVDLLLAADRSPLQAYGTRVLPHGEILDLTNDPASQRAHWIWEAAHTLNPLREKMALFWHDHFSVGVNKGGAEYLMVEHINVFRRHGLGRVRDLLIEVTRDPAMLLWLDNFLNGVPDNGLPKINENYGRELLELYTLGIGNYTQTDVVEASKCLSGWSLVGGYGSNQFVFRPDYHVQGPKTVLGRRIDNGSGAAGMQDAIDLIDTLLEQPAAAWFLAGKLWRAFVAADPPAPLLQALAFQLRSDGYDLRSLMNTILRSRYFYGAASVRRLVKSPMEFVVGAMRNLGVPVVGDYKLVGTHVATMGLPLLRYQTPAGLPGGAAWLDAQSVMMRANFAEQLTRKVDPYHIKAHFDPLLEVRRRNLRTADEIVAFYLRLLVDDDVTPQMRSLCVEFMHRVDWKRRPFVFDDDTVDRKVRGLVHIIMSLPQYSVN